MKNVKSGMLKSLLALSITLVFASTINAQDSIKVIYPTPPPAVAPAPAAAPAPAQQPTQTTTTTTQTSGTGMMNTDLRRFEFGFRYMPTFSSIKVRSYNGDAINTKVTVSQGFGILLGFNLTPNVGFQGEIDYYKVKQKFVDHNLDRIVDIKYINIPVLLSLNTGKGKPINLNFVMGPQFGFNAGTNFSSSGSDSADSLKAVFAVKKGDIGFAYGAGLEFALNAAHTARFDIGYRGFYGFVDTDGKQSGSDTYNVILKANRKTNAAYLGFTVLF